MQKTESISAMRKMKEVKKVLLYGNSRNVFSFITQNKPYIVVLGILENSMVVKEDIFFNQFPILNDYSEVAKIMNEHDVTLITFPEINAEEIKREMPSLVAGENWVDSTMFGHVCEVDFSRICRMFNSTQEAGNYIKAITNNREFALVHGNCQKDVIHNMLKSNKEFVQSYVLLRVHPIHHPQLCLNDINLLKEGFIFGCIRLFISQPVSRLNKFGDSLSTDLMKNEMSPDCKTIIFPNCFFEGYFPDYYPFRAGAEENFQKLDEISLFCSSNSILDTLILQGVSREKAIQFMHSDFYSSDKIIEESIKSIERLEKREKESQMDVIISDYVRQNYQNKLLFRSVNHPIQEVLVMVAKRILNCVGIIVDNVFYDESFSLRDNDLAVLPCVARCLFKRDGQELYFLHRSKFPECLVDLDKYYLMYYNYFEPIIANKDNFLKGKIYLNESEIYVKLTWEKRMNYSKYRIQRVSAEDNVWRTISWNEQGDHHYTDNNVKIGEKYQYKVLCYDNQDIVYTSNSVLIHLFPIPDSYLNSKL
jgi:hypothetical protein